MAETVVQLDAWLKGQEKTSFPGAGKTDYSRRYEGAAEWLNTNIHPYVEKGALLQEDGFLTDHGPDHVKTVIRRVSQLIGEPQTKLAPYEAYLLLMAIHFHDVGNIYGRKGHEGKMGEIMSEMGKLLGDDSPELRAVQMIARAHGGSLNGDKDTIDLLPSTEPVLGEQVRFQELAALLRFADEISDDKNRAARTLLKLGIIPKKSEVFHAYASHLQPVIVERGTRTIQYHFELDKESAVRKFGKLSTRVYLLAEIFERTVKAHAERIYCKRFMSEIIALDSIAVTIKVFLKAEHLDPVKEIKYRLEERGYPSVSPQQIRKLCPDLRWTAEKLKKYLMRKRNAHKPS